MHDLIQLANAPRDPALWLDAWPRICTYTAMGPLDVRLLSISDEEIVMELPITDAARQPVGLLHGGISMVLAESAASMHAAWLAPVGEPVAPVGVDINGTHIGSATGGTVRAVARPIRKSRSFVFHEIELTHVETGHVLCRSRVTNFYKSISPR